MLEILAPAGNKESAQAAIHNGANAIYLGIQAFSARQSATNFDESSLRDILFEAHLFDVKVYVAMNTLIKDTETEEFFKSLLSVWSLGVDAIILQDALLGKLIHSLYPEIVLHLSTQAGVCSVNGARFAKECGFSRVILARETPLEEIPKIADIIETEAFVQGALCTCFSGQCYFSSFAGGNSGNRGRCKQPCRKLYTYNRDGEGQKNYALSLSDLSVGEDIQKYISAGVTSFKIEGRMRRAEYVAAAVRYYRNLLEDKPSSQSLSDLKRTYNRGNYTKGLAFGQDKRFLSTAIQGHLGEKVGVVKVLNGKFFVETSYTSQQGDAFKILREGKEVGGATFVKSEKRGFSIASKQRLKNGDSVFVTTDTAVNQRLLSTQKTKTLTIDLHFHENEFAVAAWQDVCVTSSEMLQSAQNRPLSIEELKVCFSKTDGLPLDIQFGNVEIQGNIFIPKSVLNAFRRDFFAIIYEKVTKGDRQPLPEKDFAVGKLSGKNNKVAVITDDCTNCQADIVIYKPQDYLRSLPTEFLKGSFEKYIYYPAFCTTKDEEAILRLLKDMPIDGVYIENYAGLVFARENGLRVFVGTGLNIFNLYDINALLQFENVAYYAISKELTQNESRVFVSDKSFLLQTGDLKIMDLCYCPFGKTCRNCDQRNVYTLKDENGRAFPVRRFKDGRGNCRFEVYNCASLVGEGIQGVGALVDLSVSRVENIQSLPHSINKQKQCFENYTYGHANRGVE